MCGVHRQIVFPCAPSVPQEGAVAPVYQATKTKVRRKKKKYESLKVFSHSLTNITELQSYKF